MHDSDCAVHNEPAMPAAECDCTEASQAAYRSALKDAHGAIKARVDLMRQEYSALPLTFVGSITRAHHEKAAAIDALMAAGTDVFDLFIKAGGSKDEVA